MSAVGLTGTERRRLSLQQKLALAGGAGVAVAGAAVTPSAEAGIVQSTTLPLTPPASTGSNFWDVDGNGINDFRLRNNGGSSSATATINELGDARLVSTNVLALGKLNSGFVVGPAMTGGFKFHGSARGFDVTVSGTRVEGSLYGAGWRMPGTGFFGFKFTNVSGVHYGWGQMSIVGGLRGHGYTLTQAYYNDTPNATIQVGVVPEPALAGPAGVCALVMGSLAMLERRRKRQGDAADATAV